ncbi:amidase signature enzyme [Lenzites betulinus]|nr:amidase signature enzyme [Lenzites betulinus]
MWPFSSPAYLEIARRKQAHREDALRVARALHGADAGLYLRAPAKEIVERIAKGEWTASDVLDAYLARAVLAQDLTNCLTEVFFADARAQAKALDAEFAQTGKVRGPLHGVPVSFKDTYDVKGHDTTMGFSSRADAPLSEDSLVVALVREAGGIPICKTNIPQLIFFFECVNPVWGCTLNPFSKSYSSGGTSGGEAALLAMDGSALGWGTDIGGSLRIPASFCGVYSLKTGWNRMSMAGVQGTWPGFEAIRTVAGPMGRTVDDLELAARLVFGKQGSDINPAPLPYRDPKMHAKLRFGFYISDNFIKASPACQRAVRETVNALRKAGHECVEFELPHAARAMEIFIGLTAADKYRTLTADLGDDALEPGAAPLVQGSRLPGWLRNLAAWGVGKVYKDDVLPLVIRASSGKDVEEYHKWARQRDEYTSMFYREVWDKEGFDGIIAPALATPGLPHGSVQFLSTLACADLVYNVTDAPVGTLPVTRVRATDVATAEWTDPHTGRGHGSPLIEQMLYGKPAAGAGPEKGKGKGGFYDPEKMAGLPVGVQVVGRRWEDEKVIEMMRVVDDALGPRDFGPGSWKEQGK